MKLCVRLQTTEIVDVMTSSKHVIFSRWRWT